MAVPAVLAGILIFFSVTLGGAVQVPEVHVLSNVLGRVKRADAADCEASVCPPVPDTILTPATLEPEEKEEFVNLHNYYRRKEHSSNMRFMVCYYPVEKFPKFIHCVHVYMYM